MEMLHKPATCSFKRRFKQRKGNRCVLNSLALASSNGRHRFQAMLRSTIGAKKLACAIWEEGIPAGNWLQPAATFGRALDCAVMIANTGAFQSPGEEVRGPHQAAGSSSICHSETSGMKLNLLALQMALTPTRRTRYTVMALSPA